MYENWSKKELAHFMGFLAMCATFFAFCSLVLLVMPPADMPTWFRMLSTISAVVVTSFTAGHLAKCTGHLLIALNPSQHITTSPNESGG